MSDLGKIISISIAVILLATMGMTGFSLLANSDESTSVSAESFTTTLHGVAVKLDQDNIITGTVVVSNATETIIAGNYTMDLTAGTITPSADSTMLNATGHFIDYNHSPIDSSVATLMKVVMGIVGAIVAVLILMKAAGIKIDA